MKNIFLILGLICIFPNICLSDGPVPGTGTAPTSVTNPGALATIVTTPALNSGSTNGTPSANWVVSVQYYCSVSATLEILTLNASNATVATTVVPCNVPTGGVGGGGVFTTGENTFSIPQGFKISVVNVSVIVGTVQATIYYALQSVN
jgi:hypothetical protein